KRFWCDLQSCDGFYRNLPLMPDARELFETVKHLNPVILTGLPWGDWAEPQKREWGAKHFPGTKMICCMSADKRNHMKPGDILVDDFLKYKSLWIEAGGIFIHHTSTISTLAQLRERGVLPAAPPEDTLAPLPLEMALARDQITPDIAELARKAVDSHTEGMGHTRLDAAKIYASYTIIRERQLIQSRAELASLRETISTLQKTR